MNESIGTPPGSGPERRLPGSRRAIAIVRVLLLLGAAGALAAGTAARLRDHGGDLGPVGGYLCPMHPEIRAAAPGQCPICRMALEPARPGDGEMGPAGATGRMAGMADLTAIENIRKHRILDFVRMRSLILDLRDLRAPAAVDGDGEITGFFYPDQVASLLPDEVGAFSPGDAPELRLPVQRTAEAPVPWDRVTLRVRFRVLPPPAGQLAQPGSSRTLRADETGWLDLGKRMRNVLTVPAGAIVQSPDGPYVLSVPGGGRAFEKRPIEIGETYLHAGFAIVLSGLRAQERVVGKATFFLDADRRLGLRASDASRGGL